MQLKFKFLCLATLIASLNLFAEENIKAKKEEEEKFPISVSTGLTNSVGIGTFAQGHTNSASFETQLGISPSYSLPKLGGKIASSVSLNFSLGMQWLDSMSTTASTADNRLQYSDILFIYTAAKILDWDSAGLSFGAQLSGVAPISRFSDAMKRVVGYGASLFLNWEAEDFSLGLNSGYSGWAYSSGNQTVPCSAASRSFLPSNNGNFMSLVPYTAERDLGDGQCVISGRQEYGTLINSILAAWSPGNHSVSIGARWYITFLKPLVVKLGLPANGSNLTEASSGTISYTYSFPVEDYDLSISTGMTSVQSAYTNDGRIRFPFIDLLTPANNFTQFFVTLTAGV